MCFSPQRRANFRHQHVQKCCEPHMFWRFWLPNVPFATAACIFSTSARTKVVQTRHVLKILTSRCAFRHSRVHFFNISTYKSGPHTSCFVHFHFRMCFSPQRRAIFRHQNFKKFSEDCSFLTFSLPNVLFATAACNFWFIRWPPDSAPAALTGLLFDWPDTRIFEKTQHFVTSLTFSADVSSFTWLWHYCIFCRLTWRLYCWAMHLVFNSPYCRKFLFKLPSISKWYCGWFSRNPVDSGFVNIVPLPQRVGTPPCWSQFQEAHQPPSNSSGHLCCGYGGPREGPPGGIGKDPENPGSEISQLCADEKRNEQQTYRDLKTFLLANLLMGAVFFRRCKMVYIHEVQCEHI